MPRKKKTGPKPTESSDGQPSSEDVAVEEAAKNSRKPKPKANFPIVGIGASAGGLAAFEAFFSGMPPGAKPGMAFVLVQHLAPDHKSILSELIRRYTDMRVYQVKDGMTVKPNCAYIIPPNHDMAFLNGTLQLLEPASTRGMRMPIDFFFRSLANDQRERAICVVLSGTGSDGSMGVRAIKAEGGMAMAQSPETAEYDGMPRSAIDTGLVDYVMPAGDMAGQLIRYVAHSYLKSLRELQAPATNDDGIVNKICVLLRDYTGHDFSQYKLNTLSRRIARRMAVHQIDRPEDYLRHLRATPAEAQTLFRDLLIGVTNFFRDAPVYEALETEAIPQLFAEKPEGSTIRAWVCGCATGEEAYSLAILLYEHLEELRKPYTLQLFATDINPEAVEFARAGIYSAAIEADVTPERLRRFFVQSEDGKSYRVQKTIRDLLIFSVQDLVKDPPISRLDLISCRNLLIYMNGDLQKKIIPMFHYALNPDGLLLLGTSESIGEFGWLFTTVDRKQKLYKRENDMSGGRAHPIGNYVPPFFQWPGPSEASRRESAKLDKGNLGELTEQSLLDHCGQAGILVNSRGEILHIHGRTGNYLEPATGSAAMNVLSMAREGLRPALTSALYKVVTHKQPVEHLGLRVKTNGDFTLVDLHIRPAQYTTEPSETDLFLVIIGASPKGRGTGGKTSSSASGRAGKTTKEENARIAELELELGVKDEYLQSTLEEMETSNEELKSINEELQSVNEEMQSTNEELETSKEELQSVNEELATVNSELQTKVADLSRANNDMNNLLAGTGVATVFVDHQLRILRFTPGATELINLIPSDVGRPVGHIVCNLVNYDGLVADVNRVLDDLIPYEQTVRTGTGMWFLMHIRPYRTLENVIEGAVITFTDITKTEQVRGDLIRQEKDMGAIINGMFNAFVVLEPIVDDDGVLTNCRFSLINDAFETLTGVTEDQVIGKTMLDVWPDTEKAWFETFGQVVENESPSHFDLHHGPTAGHYLCNAFRRQVNPAQFCVIFEDLKPPKKPMRPRGKAKH